MAFSNRTTRLSPEQYAEAVTEHAATDAGSSMYPGSNYENLAKFLQQPDEPDDANLLRYRRCNHFFVSLVSVGEGSLDPAKRFSNVEEFVQYQNNVDAPSLLFMRGYPSPKWLRNLGSVYNIDPEFFQRHLEFRSTIGKIDYYPLPSLPSSSRNNIQLSMTTLGEWGNWSGRRTHEKELNNLRSKCARSMKEYNHDVSLGRGIETGDSIVRAFAVIDGLNFSMEQTISLCISWNGDIFTVIIWLDVGFDLSQGPNGPWRNPSNHEHLARTRLYPLIQHRPWMALESQDASIPPEERKDNNSNFAQSASVMDLTYGRQLEAKLIVAHPFYALSDLLQFTAYSNCTFLNMVESKLEAEKNFALVSNLRSKSDYFILSHTGLTLSNLLYNRDLLDSYAQRIRNTLAWIKNKGGPEWAGTLKSEQKLRTDALAFRIEQDYEHLLGRAENLARRCHQGLDVIMNDAVVAESKEALRQSKEVAKLTRLAYFFIPLSFTASFLGMNMYQFGNGTVQLWIWFAVSVPVFAFSVLLLYFDITKAVRRLLGWAAQQIRTI